MLSEYGNEIEHYKTLIDNVPGCIALVLRKGTREIIAANKLARQIGAIPGKVCFEHCSLIDTPCHWCLAPALWEEDEPQKKEIEHQGKWYEGIWAPLSPEFYVHYIFEITERKEAEQKKIDLELSLQQNQKMEALGVLAGGIAHDFNNILGAILGYTELTMLSMKADPKARENLKEVLSASRRAKELVQQILTFSSKAAESREPVQMHLVVGEAMRLLRQTIPTTIDIKQNFVREKDTVLADPTQLHQIVMNLCTNAYHAMRNGGTLTVALRHVENGANETKRLPELDVGEYVKLSIEDTGTGIAPEDLTKVYEPFFTTKPMGEGTGMGLAVVHGIVKSHGGTIDVDSRLGQGTRFDIYLPFHSGELAASVARFASPPGGSERILVVDDEPELSKMMSEILKGLGYDAQPVNSSMEALERVRKNPDAYDLVITDQTMPQMTGAVLTQQIREIRNDLPVIICTGYSETLDEKRASSIGANALLYKPIEIALMARVIREVVAK